MAVQLNNGEEYLVTSVRAQRLVRSSATALVLAQFSLAATFIVLRSGVARVHRMLQQTDVLFGW